jgi:uncharacterized protein (TIGR03437 family)
VGPADSGGGAIRAGITAAVYANSLGLTTPLIPAGETAAANILRNPVELFINEVPQRVLKSGLVPGEIGVYRLEFEVDPATPVGAEDENRLWIRMGDQESARLVVSLESRAR